MTQTTLSIDDIKSKYSFTSPTQSRKRSLAEIPDLPNKKPRTETRAELKDIYARIDALDSKKTAYQKRLYKLLCQVPAGRVSTYGALSRALKSSPRAVGNALRENPLAPDVPCHRIVASDGQLGGFKGDWGLAGKYAKDKLALLRDEGVFFDAKGKLHGSKPFEDFVPL